MTSPRYHRRANRHVDRRRSAGAYRRRQAPPQPLHPGADEPGGCAPQHSPRGARAIGLD